MEHCREDVWKPIIIVKVKEAERRHKEEHKILTKDRSASSSGAALQTAPRIYFLDPHRTHKLCPKRVHIERVIGVGHHKMTCYLPGSKTGLLQASANKILAF